MQTLMIVDDEPLSRFSLRTVLSQAFTDITIIAEAESGQEAIEYFERFRPDAVLMDVRLPDMSGITASERILEKFPSARIVICTAYDNFSFVSHALDIGVKGFLLKPVRREEIVQKVERLFSKEPSVIEQLAEQKMLEQMICGQMTEEMLTQLNSYYAGLDAGVMMAVQADVPDATMAILKRLATALPGGRKAFVCMHGEIGCMFAAQARNVEQWNQLAESMQAAEHAICFRWSCTRLKGNGWRECFEELCGQLNRPGNAESEGETQGSLKERLTEVLAFPDSELRDMSLEKLAEQMGISAQYLSVIFKEQFSVTFIAYVTRRRMDYAGRQLRENRRSLEQIAADCGYNDPAYFKRLFKKTFGISPREYARGKN